MKEGIVIPSEDGTAGQVLTSNGAGTEPTFQTASAPSVQYAFAASANGSQTNIVPSGVIPLQLPTENFDVGGNYDNGTYIFTSPVAGYYQFNAHCRFRNMDSAASSYNLYFTTTGGGATAGDNDVFDPRQFNGDVAGDITLRLAKVIFLPSSGTIVCNIQQVSGSTQTDVDGASFSGIFIGS